MYTLNDAKEIINNQLLHFNNSINPYETNEKLEFIKEYQQTLEWVLKVLDKVTRIT